MMLTTVEMVKILQFENQPALLNQAAFDQIRPDAETSKKHLRRYKDAAENLSRQNKFVPPPSAPEPPSGCNAIFGDAARIGERWVQVGDKVSDARVLAIEPTRVVLLWQAKEFTLAPKLAENNSNRRSSSSSRYSSSNRSRNSRSNRGRGR